ncbi:TetR/AcrR family transcriptional repressor of nem operon [Bradyrhizobium elkanii]|nr:TetR/AcrR family transcriptional repressor of nem operon [Bradyrhizobium elkanii]
MKSAGLTHGGFYLHFKSRRDLIEKAFAQAMDGSVEKWRKVADGSSHEERLRRVVDYYLTQQHREDVGHGCALPLLGAEAPRAGAAIRRTFSSGLREIVAILSEDSRGTSKREAISIVSEMVGALLLARAVDHTEFASEILSAARASVLGTDPQTTGPSKRQRKSPPRTIRQCSKHVRSRKSSKQSL